MTHEHRDTSSMVRVSSFSQLIDAADRYRQGDPVAVHVLSSDLVRRAGDFMSGLACASRGDLRVLTGARWLLRPRARRFDSVEIHEKRHRGPRLLWPVGSTAVRIARRLPHWARRVDEAVDRAVFDTTIIIVPADPPPPSGVREPRRPLPDGPSTARSIDEPSLR